MVEVEERATTSRELVRAGRRTDVVLWVSSGAYHSRSVMEDLRAQTTTVAWHADLFHGLSGRLWDWLASPMWAAEHVFTADGGNGDAWQAMGVRHRWLLPGVRERWTVEGGRLREAFRCDVAFVGARQYHGEWPYRVELLDALEAMCGRRGWSFLNPGGRHRRVDRGRRLNDFYRSARVVVGDSLCLEREEARYWSDRVYETTGRGGLLVMPYVAALAADFPCMPFYRWGDWDHLEDIIGGLLGDSVASDGIRAECRATTVRGHTYRSRVRTMLEAIG